MDVATDLARAALRLEALDQPVQRPAVAGVAQQFLAVDGLCFGRAFGGQQQRAAIARALVQKAEVILADEPIASLDPRNTRIVMDALQRINSHYGITVICNLHSLETARAYCDRLIGMAQGRVVFDDVPQALTDEVARGLYGLDAGEIMDTAGTALPAPAAPYQPSLAVA